jgi:hypothetical protein
MNQTLYAHMNFKKKKERKIGKEKPGEQETTAPLVYNMAVLLLTAAVTRCAVPIPFIHAVPPSIWWSLTLWPL